MKKRTKYGLTIVGIIAILTFMTMAITNMNKKSILEKDSHKTGKLVATKPEIEKALEEMNQEEEEQKDSDIFLVLSINPKFMLHIKNDTISEIYQLNRDAKIFTNEDFQGLSLTDGLTKIQEILKENDYLKEDAVINISIYEYSNIDVVEATNIVASCMNSFIASGLKVENPILKAEEINEIKTQITNYREYNEIPVKYDTPSLNNTNKYPKKLPLTPPKEEEPKVDIVIDTPETNEPVIKDEPTTDIEEPKDEPIISKPAYDTSKFHNLYLTELNSLFAENKKSLVFLGNKDNAASLDILTSLNTLTEELEFTTNYLEIPSTNFNEWRYSIHDFLSKLTIETELNGTMTKVGDYIYETAYTPVVLVINNSEVTGCLTGSKTLDELKTFINNYYLNNQEKPDTYPIDTTKVKVLTPSDLMNLFNKETLEVLYIGSITNKESSSYLSELTNITTELNITPNYLELDVTNPDTITFLGKVSETNSLGGYILSNNYSPAVILIKNNTVVYAYTGTKTREETREIINKYLGQEEPTPPVEPPYDLGGIKEVEPDELMNLFNDNNLQVLFVGSRYTNIGSDMIPTLNKLSEELNIKTNFLDMKTYSFNKWREEVKGFLDKVNVMVNINGLRMTIGEYIYLGGFKSSIIILKDGVTIDGFIGNKSYDETKSLINKYISISG